MFDWIWMSGLSIWGAWNFWSLAVVGVVMMLGAVLWKAIITPKEYQERLAWEQNKENQKMTQTRVRRLGITVLLWLFGFMSASVFVLSMYKVLT